MLTDFSRDPLAFVELCWPHISLISKQAEILESFRDNRETFVPSGAELGKTFLAALAALWFFLTRQPSRVIIISPSRAHCQGAFWPELRQLIDTSVIPLPLTYDSEKALKWRDNVGREYHALDYIKTVVMSDKPERFFGRHLKDDMPRVACIIDEATALRDEYYTAQKTWSHRLLAISNPHSTINFFYAQCKRGDMADPAGEDNLLQRVIHIKATDSPNVQAWESCPQGSVAPRIVPGILSGPEYARRQATLSDHDRTVYLDGEFDDTAGSMMFPSAWCYAAMRRAEELMRLGPRREAKGLGIDTGQGRDLTVWTVIDELGIIEQTSQRTEEATTIADITVDKVMEYGLEARRVCIDFGGGGNEVASFLRRHPPHGLGLDIRRVAFGEGPSRRDKTKSRRGRDDNRVRRNLYRNRRVEMYDHLRRRLQPGADQPFALLPDGADGARALFQELTILPLKYDGEGKLYLISKDKDRPTEPCIRSMLGRSPDRADSLVLAIWAMDTARPMPVVFEADPSEAEVFERRIQDNSDRFASQLAAIGR